MKIVNTALVCLLLGTSIAAIADDPPVLAHNPFSRPPSEGFGNGQPVTKIDGESRQTLALRATMVGEAHRLADVAGRILKPGDEVQGYLLVSVHERYAVFRKGGESINVYVKPNVAEEDE